MAGPSHDETRRIIQKDSVKKFVTPEQKRQRKVALIVLLLIIGIAAGGYLVLVPREKSYHLSTWDSAAVMRGDLPRVIQASGTVTIPEQMTIVNPEEGYAAGLFVEVGETVSDGELLAIIDVPDLEDQLYDLQLDLEDKQKQIQRTEVQNEITNARKEREITRLRDDVLDELAEREKLIKLVEINASRKSELDTQENKIKTLREEITEKEEQLNEDRRLQQLEIEMIELNIRQLHTTIDRLKADIAEAEIKSPLAGEILELNETLAVTGSLIGKNQELLTIANPETAIVELEVDEEYAGALIKSQKATLEVSGATLGGEITGIGRTAQSSSDGLGGTVLVKVKPEQITDALISGATAVGRFEIGALENILILPRGPYLSTGNQRYLYKIEGNTAYKTEAVFGKSEGNFIEVISGVTEGDEVITSGYQNFIEYKTITLKRGE